MIRFGALDVKRTGTGACPYGEWGLLIEYHMEQHRGPVSMGNGKMRERVSPPSACFFA